MTCRLQLAIGALIALAALGGCGDGSAQGGNTDPESVAAVVEETFPAADPELCSTRFTERALRQASLGIGQDPLARCEEDEAERRRGTGEVPEASRSPRSRSMAVPPTPRRCRGGEHARGLIYEFELVDQDGWRIDRVAGSRSSIATRCSTRS